METTLISPAIHESARVVFAYLNGYWCDSIRLEANGEVSGAQLNPGNDGGIIQQILTGGKTSSMSASEKDHAVKTAKKLMAIYCAGACAETFLQNEEQLPNELNLDIPAADLRNIEKIQAFLNASVVDHADEYPSHTLVTVLKKIAQPEVWKPIKALAQKLVESETKSLTGFYIEDTLMMHGIRRQKQTSSQGFVVGVAEDKSPAKKETPAAGGGKPDTLDSQLTDFLKLTRPDWTPEELSASIMYLKKLFALHGDR